MPIPELVDNVLPEGVHDCTFEEIAAVFGQFQRSDKRMRLTDALRTYLTAAKQSRAVTAVIIDGSYVTAVEEPEDIDLLVVLPVGWDFTAELKPYLYNVVTKTGIKRMRYPFDVYVYAAGSPDFDTMLEFFSRVNSLKYPGLTTRARKGTLRVVP